MYSLEVKLEADKIFKKLAKKDIKLLKSINKKLNEVQKDPFHKFKFLRKPLQRFNRVHIGASFVLIFKIDHTEKVVIVFYFDHHNNVYAWRPKL